MLSCQPEASTNAQVFVGINEKFYAPDIDAKKHMVEPVVLVDENCDLIANYSFLNDHVSRLQGTEVCSESCDDANYSQAWYIHHRQREKSFWPWNPSLGPAASTWESLRLEAVHNLWRSARGHRISPVTIHLSIWLMNHLLYSFTQMDSPKCMNRDLFAGTVAVSFRTALKFEERPEALWSIRRLWEVLPMFDHWTINRSDQFLLQVEASALRVLNDCLDVPVSVQYFDKYIAVGGWPQELWKDYTSLGHFLLALATFAGGSDHPLMNISPSKLAAAAVVLSVKVVNGDSRRSYEFFPDRFAAFTQLTMRELQPAIRGLSAMLRKKPEGVRDLRANAY